MNEKLIYFLISFFAFVNLLVFLYSENYNKCFKAQKCLIVRIITIFAFYIHYFLIFFCLYGFLFDNKIILIIYLISLPTICLCWYIFNNHHFSSACPLTHYTDTLCNVDDNNSLCIIDIHQILGIPSVQIFTTRVNSLCITITTLGYLIAIYKLFFT